MVGDNADSVHSGRMNDDLINNKYLVGNKLGSGNFGLLKIVKNIEDDKFYAVKLEPTKYNNRQLYFENKWYSKFKKSKENIIGIPSIYYYGMYKSNYALVMDLLGPSLEAMFDYCNRSFSPITVAKIAIQTIRRIELVHSHDIVFRDIKPENFLIANDRADKTTIFIVDFGLSKEFIDPKSKKHIPYKEGKCLTGTARYMSINTHLGKEQSRRDDLESIGHMLFYFLRGSLPWQGLKESVLKERYRKIGLIKQKTSISELGKGFPSQFSKYLDYSRNLEFEEKPDYDKLVGYFEDYLESVNAENDFVMDWNLKPDFKIIDYSNENYFSNIAKSSKALNVQYSELKPDENNNISKALPATPTPIYDRHKKKKNKFSKFLKKLGCIS